MLGQRYGATLLLLTAVFEARAGLTKGVGDGTASIRLEVWPASGHAAGIAMDEAAMEEAGVFDGDVVAVSGGRGRSTLCVVHVGKAPAGAEVGWCTLGRTEQRNAGARIGGTVHLAPPSEGVAAAVTVYVAPFADSLAAAGLAHDETPAALLERLLAPQLTAGLPVRAGDTLECYLEGVVPAVEFRVVDVDTAAAESDARGGIVPESGCAVAVAPDALLRSDEADEVGYDDLGGVDRALATVRELVEAPLARPGIFAAVGVAPPRGVLLHGAPGCGKTSLARAVASETGAYFFLVNGAEILSKQPGEAEANLRKAFDAARAHAPAIIFLDEVDAVAPRRDGKGGGGGEERRVVRALCDLLDELERDHAHAAVVVLAATNRANAVHPALRRYGRLDREVDVGAPNAAARLDLLRVRTRGACLAADVDLEALARDTHGFVGADVAQLCLEAAYECVREAFPPASTGRCALLSGYTDRGGTPLALAMAHFRAALDRVNPSALRETAAALPEASWADVGGLDDVKRELRETVEFPVRHAAKFRALGLPPSRGVLFYGPPGCGKTLLAQAVARECGANFVSVKGPELLTMWFGESEANVRSLFEKARASAPCILFFDEIDAIAKQRGSGQGGASEAGDRVINQILTEIDGVGARKDVFVIGATNRPEVLDAAVTRPGRLDTLVYIPLPDRTSRAAVLRAALRRSPVAPDVDLDLLAECTPGFSGADCAEVCKRAARFAIRDAVHAAAAGTTGPRAVGACHFELAMAAARRSVSDAELAKYDAYAAKQKVSADVDEPDSPRAFSFTAEKDQPMTFT
jgi:transitional endoplasmic reticulum ATPase